MRGTERRASKEREKEISGNERKEREKQNEINLMRRGKITENEKVREMIIRMRIKEIQK